MIRMMLEFTGDDLAFVFQTKVFNGCFNAKRKCKGN